MHFLVMLTGIAITKISTNSRTGFMKELHQIFRKYLKSFVGYLNLDQKINYVQIVIFMADIQNFFPSTEISSLY
jgi:5'-3' exonuclease